MSEPTDAPDLKVHGALSGEPLDEGRTSPLTTLAGVLPDLLKPRQPSAAGVPLPPAWKRVRAVYGGASRDDLEEPRNDATVSNFAAAGAYLPAGLHIITGQTGGGKSALVLNLADAAISAGHPVLYVSLELDDDELGARLVALRSGVTWAKLAQRRALSADETTAASAAIDGLAQHAQRFRVLAPEGKLSMAMVRSEALTLWREHERVPLVVFDYLQAPAAIAEADGWRPQLREQIAAATMELRRISRKMPAEKNANGDAWLGCPVVVLSVTARANVKGESAVRGMGGSKDGKPADPDELRFEDLETLKALPKEAGEVETTAVTAWVMALGERAASGMRPLCLRLAKSRMSAPGAWIPFNFTGATGALAEAPERYETARSARSAATQDADTSARNGAGTARSGRLLRRDSEEG